MGGGGSGGAHFGKLPGTLATEASEAVSVWHSWLPFRQRQRVHQSLGSRDAEQVADRADEIAAAEIQRQRSCGIEKRSGDSQAYGLRSYCVGASRSDQRVLRGTLQSVSEFSPAMRSSGDEERQQRQDRSRLQVVRHTVGNPTATARAERMAERRYHRGAHGTAGGGR